MNIHTKILFFIFSMSIALYGVHSFAIKTNLYWTTSWADSVAHTMGGTIVAGVFIYLFSLKKEVVKVRLNTVFLITLIVGIVWEIFEVYTGQTFISDKGYALDTFGDLFFDIFGAYLAHLFLIETLHE